MISTSADSIVTLCPSTIRLSEPVVSSCAICPCSNTDVAAAIPFIIFPNFLPMVLKLHFTFFTRTPWPSTNFSSFTLTSFIIRSFTASIWRCWLSSMAGTMMACNGWRTLMFTLRRRASTIDVIFCAIAILSSRSASMTLSSNSGYVARCTEHTLSRPVAFVRSR